MLLDWIVKCNHFFCRLVWEKLFDPFEVSSVDEKFLKPESDLLNGPGLRASLALDIWGDLSDVSLYYNRLTCVQIHLRTWQVVNKIFCVSIWVDSKVYRLLGAWTFTQIYTNISIKVSSVLVSSHWLLWISNISTSTIVNNQSIFWLFLFKTVDHCNIR